MSSTLSPPPLIGARGSELAPMAPVGPVTLTEILIVLEGLLLETAVPPPSQRYGKVFIGPIEAARGLSFDAVLVPGLAEKMFPRKIVEEPILLDAIRTMLLKAVRAHAGIALWPAGEQALANCQRLIDMARHFEGGASSFRAFVERLEANAELSEAEEASIIEEGTEGVRVMTVHKSKGLEFPVVILADPTCNATRDTPSRHVEPARRLWLEPLCGSAPIELREAADEELRREQAEAIRVAYVAVTRARDLLVVPTCGDRPIEGWLQVLDPTLYPPDGARRQSGTAPCCPIFGDDSVLEREPKGSPPGLGSVRPGLHHPIADGPPVVWWDPAALSLDVEEQAPLRHQRIPAGGSRCDRRDGEREELLCLEAST
jgi:UvrD-like helicase C-terminal domain